MFYTVYSVTAFSPIYIWFFPWICRVIHLRLFLYQFSNFKTVCARRYSHRRISTWSRLWQRGRISAWLHSGRSRGSLNKRLNWEMKVQWNPALRTPALCGQFRLSRQKAHIFSPKLTRFIRTPVNSDNGHFSVSRVTNSHILSTPLYGHWLSAHCLFSLSHLCDNCRHCTLFK